MAIVRTILVTGGCGFIGSSVCRSLCEDPQTRIVNVDSLTYAGNPDSVKVLEGKPNYRFVKADICDRPMIEGLFREENVTGVLNLAAESHVDRSIMGADEFVRTNVNGAFAMLEAARAYWNSLSDERRETFRFVQISTDEVYGTLGLADPAFTEETPYRPNSPYAASKAAADHLALAWHETYGLPVIVTNCSNNYGPYHFPEKLIPLVILNCLEGKELPVYGSGANIRDWLFVEDHVSALDAVLRRGFVGEKYNIGGEAERTNLDVVRTICSLLDDIQPRPDSRTYADQIVFVKDRPGHDFRYAMNTDHIRAKLGWKPSTTFEEGLDATVRWYLANEWWWRPIREKKYAGQRLGLLA